MIITSKSPAAPTSVATTLPADPELRALRQRLGEEVTRTVQAISRDNFERMQVNTFINLSRGIWYTADYYPRLKELAKTNVLAQERLTFLRDSNRFYHPQPPKHFRLRL